MCIYICVYKTIVGTQKLKIKKEEKTEKTEILFFGESKFS